MVVLLLPWQLLLRACSDIWLKISRIHDSSVLCESEVFAFRFAENVDVFDVESLVGCVRHLRWMVLLQLLLAVVELLDHESDIGIGHGGLTFLVRLREVEKLLLVCTWLREHLDLSFRVVIVCIGLHVLPLLLLVLRFRLVFRDRGTITAAHLSCRLYIPDPLQHMIDIEHPPISHRDPILGNIGLIISNTFLLSIHRHLSSDLINLGQILVILCIIVQPFQILDSL